MNATWNRLVSLLEKEVSAPPPTGRQKSAYLPYLELPAYGRLAQDWLALLRLNMPGYDVLPHLVDMVGIHLVLYFLRRASEWVQENQEPPCVEMIAPKRTTVRDLATESYSENGLLSGQAVQKYIDREITQSEEWKIAKASTDPFGNCAAVVREKVLWNEVDGDLNTFPGKRTPTGLIETLRIA